MSTEVGVWVDHRRALVVRYSAKETSSETILSNIEKSASTSGGSTSHAPKGPRHISEETRDRKFDQSLDQFYERVSMVVRGASSILITGPGEAKNELKKHLEKSKQKPRPDILIETADKMTDPQFIAKVKQHYSR